MASFTITWDSSYEADPSDTDIANLLGDDVRDVKRDVRERLEIDHSWAGDGDDGTHKKATLLPQGSDPTPTSSAGFVYGKDVGGVTELFYMDSNSPANVIQLTEGGVLKDVVNTASGVISVAAILANNTYLLGKETGGTQRNLIALNSSDQVEVGDDDNPLRMFSSDNPTIDAAGDVLTPHAHAARHLAGGGDAIARLIQGLTYSHVGAAAGSNGTILTAPALDLSSRSGVSRVLLLAFVRLQFLSGGGGYPLAACTIRLQDNSVDISDTVQGVSGIRPNNVQTAQGIFLATFLDESVSAASHTYTVEVTSYSQVGTWEFQDIQLLVVDLGLV